MFWTDDTIRVLGGEMNNTLHDNSEEQAIPAWKTAMQEITVFFKYMIITVIVVFAITRLIFPVAAVPTGSMEDLIPAGSIVLCSKVSYWFDTPHRGDVVLFQRAESANDNTFYVKRVVGEPGDELQIIDGRVFINGELYNETWLKETPEALDFGPVVVPKGQYFCMGDNRNDSLDCRYWTEHFVPENRMFAKVLVVLSHDKIAMIRHFPT